MSVDYLLSAEAAPQREYAKQAAADGVITYSYSTEGFKWVEPQSSASGQYVLLSQSPLAADIQQATWIDTIFGFVDSITGLSFQKVDGQRGELHFNFVTEDHTRGAESFGNGYGQIVGVHNKALYGGRDDIRSISRAVLQVLGVGIQGGRLDNPAYTSDKTILSSNDQGRTFFLTEDDQSALKTIFGSAGSGSDVTARVHSQRLKEDLMLGTTGIADTFRLTAKGVITEDPYIIKGGPKVFEGMSTNYNIPYIANFDPADGDKILISKRLFNTVTPIDGNNLNNNRAPKGLKIRFKNYYGPNLNYTSNHNVYYNGAGKLQLDVNGRVPGPGPHINADSNAYMVAFVDPVGPASLPFKAQWVGLF
jgi:hypothetical protein